MNHSTLRPLRFVGTGLAALALAGGLASAAVAQSVPVAPSSATTAPAAPPSLAPHGPPAGPRGPLRPTSSTVDALTQRLATAKADRDFAADKMDVTRVNTFLGTAEALIAQAGPNLSSTDATIASTAREQGAAARASIGAADAELRATLDGRLPSQANRPAPPAPPTGATAPNPQVRASRDAARTYQEVATATAAAKANAAIDTRGLVGAAQALYGQAVQAYQAGQYERASGLTHAAAQAAAAAGHLLRAGGATDQPVSVPAPTF